MKTCLVHIISISLRIEYINDDNRVLGMKYLLGTWEIMIHDIKSVWFHWFVDF